MTNEIWNVSSYLAEQFGTIPIATQVLLLAQEVLLLAQVLLMAHELLAMKKQ